VGLHPEDRSFEAVPPHFFSPPTETRTWFHQGPIGDEFGDWEETDFSGEFSQEFWPGDATLPQSQVLSRPASMTDFLKGLPRRVKRDALRALRGRILRTELYALDDTERQDRPYTVTEYLHGVREKSLPAPGEEERERIFFPHTLAQRVTQWERGDDPMTQFTFTGDYDDYGQPRSQISIAVPRARDFRVAAAPGEPYLATHTVTAYAQRDDEQHYIVDRVARTTTYEILNDGSAALFDLLKTIGKGSVRSDIISQTLNFYDGPSFQGLSFRQIGDYGALVRTESLVLTEHILHEAYKSGSTVLSPPEMPPYLMPGASPAWTEEYPQEFRDLLPPLAGYTYQPGGGSEYEAGYFAATERRCYDFHKDPAGKGRGLVKVKRDPLGYDTTIGYDTYELLPTEVSNPADLTTRVTYDYRVLQPSEVADPNANRTAYIFTPLGLLESTAIMGKAGENVGDTLTAPGTRLAYDFLAFADPNRRQPVSVCIIRRVHHVNETDVPLPERDETIETIEYSDGFGRLLQTRTQAEDITFGDPVFGGAVLSANQDDQAGTRANVIGRQRTAQDLPNVVVSGWQIYDNKGRVVEKYEPRFSTGWDYAPPTDAERGQKVTLYYDPRGHVIRMVNPDSSEQWVIFGVPHALTDPDRFTPTPWDAYTYDANDNAGRTHHDPSLVDPHHWNTPASTVVDALGRTVETTERNGTNQDTDWYITRSAYDIRGNLLTITDALGRLAFRYVYDLTNKPLRIGSIDAGLWRTVLDAADNEIERRDSKSALILQAYDVLNRPIRLWARDGASEPFTLREHLVYGDGPDAEMTFVQAATANLLGKLYKHYDEAGLLTFEDYDFKGSVLEKARQVISDAAILAVFYPPPPNWQAQAFRVDWQPAGGMTLENHASRLLDPAVYRTSATYDALNRVKTMHYPQGVEGARKQLRPHYNRAGALERVELDGTTYVDHIAYNAKGQRTLILYGNGVMTRHAYDPHTFRLVRLRSERYTTPAPLTYQPTGTPLQDFAYKYDLIGNINTIRDRTPDSGMPNTPLGVDALDQSFTYDPLYRLLSATGRECDIPPPVPWDDQPRCTDLTRTRAYTENYQYDPVGNMKQWQHQAGGRNFTRVFALGFNSNRLSTVTIGATDYPYVYDDSGNLIQENATRHFEWDYGDRMRVFRTQPENAEPSLHAHYLYDASGQRVKKLVRKQGGHVEVTVYVDGIFEHHRLGRGGVTQENNTLHVMDNQSRIVLVRVGRPFSDDSTPAVRYHLGDHLSSSNVVVNDTGAWVNKEEYTPYGETSFGSFTRKRYRFSGKERDEESGLYYHGARYYAMWLARWTGTDPVRLPDDSNLYTYSKNNPIRFQDRLGTQTEDTDKDKPRSDPQVGAELSPNAPRDKGKTNLSASSQIEALDELERRWISGESMSPEERRQARLWWETKAIEANRVYRTQAFKELEFSAEHGGLRMAANIAKGGQVIAALGGLVLAAPVLAAAGEGISLSLGTRLTLAFPRLIPWGTAIVAALAGQNNPNNARPPLLRGGGGFTPSQAEEAAAQAVQRAYLAGTPRGLLGQLFHQLLGARPKGVDRFISQGAGQVELKTTYYLSGIPQAVVRNASQQTLRYSVEYQGITGWLLGQSLVPIRIVKIFNIVTGETRLGP
jgi:RHS repeat-associated protein